MFFISMLWKINVIYILWVNVLLYYCSMHIESVIKFIYQIEIVNLIENEIL